jgi:outer membrane protein assembly factor BamE (lipoprotein component of BamABCDE complex)
MQVYIKIFLVFFIISCARTKYEGVILDDSEVQKLKLGLSKAEVALILGSPSIDIPEIEAEPNTWIYISSGKKWYAFFTPKLETHRVIEVQFKKNNISKINFYDKSDIKQNSSFETKLKDYKKPK